MSHWSGSKNWKQGENCWRWDKSAGWKNILNSQWMQDWTTSLFAHSAKCQNSFRNFSETVKDRSGERDTWTNDWGPLWEQGCGCTTIFKNLSGPYVNRTWSDFTRQNHFPKEQLSVIYKAIYFVQRDNQHQEQTSWSTEWTRCLLFYKTPFGSAIRD